MAELKKGVLSDELNEKDIEKEALASAEIDGVTGGSGVIWSHNNNSFENKRPERRPAAKSVVLKSTEGVFVASDAPDEK